MSSQGTLHKYFLNNGELRLHKWLHYLDIYERHFERFRNRPIKMLEIGVHSGGSLRMWHDYFHEGSTIVGIDIDPDCKQHEDKGANINVHIGSQDDADFLQTITDQYGEFDIILDDGSHLNSHLIKTFEILYPYVSKTGVYMAEDLHTSYWHKWGGGLRKKGTFIEYAKDKIDEQNANHVRGDFPNTTFTKTIDSIAFYDSIVVFEKRPQGKRQHLKTMAMSDDKT